MRQRPIIRRGIAAAAAASIAIAAAVFGVVAPAHAAGYEVSGTASLPQTLSEHEPFTIDVSTLSITPAPTSGTVEFRTASGSAGTTPIGYPPVVPSFSLETGWAGHTIWAVLSFTGPEGTVEVTTNTTDPILAEGVRPAALSISGSGIVGTPFTVTTGSSWGSTPTSISYEWRRVDTNAVVQTGSSSSYTPTVDLVGTPVYVTATATRDSLPSATSTSSFSSTVRLAEFANVPAPTVSGTGVLGTAFTAGIDTSGVTPTPGAVVFDWYSVADGALLQSGGTTYTPTSAQLGLQVYVIATLGATNTSPYVTTNSPFSATVRLDEFANVPAPTVSGTGILGTDFTAALDTAGVTPAGADVRFDWYRVDTGVLVQADAETFTPSSALLGTGVYVIATLTAPNTSTYITTNSPFSATVRLDEFANVPAPTVTGSGELGTSFTAALDTAGVTPTPATVAFTWYRADTDAVVQTGGTTFTPTFALAGTGVYVIATLTAPNTSTFVTTNSAFSSTVHLASFTPGAGPVLVGQHALGGELTAVTDTTGWSPVPDSFTFAWFLQDGTPIAGATDQTLAIDASLVGEVVYAVVTAHAVDTQPYEIASAPSGLIAAPTFALDGTAAVVAGSSVTLEGWGLLFDETVEIELRSSPLPLGSFVAGPDGTLSATVTVPSTTAAGRHHLVVLRDGVELGRVAIDVTVPPSALTGTGLDGAGLGLVALAAALSVGVGLVAARRRRPA